MRKLYSIIALLLPVLAHAQAPTDAPPTPTQDAADVISVYSDAYDDTTVDTYATEWSVAAFMETTIADNAVLMYSDLDYAGMEMVGENAIDLMAAGMTHLHFDFWSPNSTNFIFKLVDFGGDGYQAGEDTNDTEAPVERVLTQGQWISLDLPLTDFAGMNMSDISQIVIASAPAGTSTVYLDNIYFYDGGEPAELPVPTEAAPAPERDAADVVSIFSDAYEDVPLDTIFTTWSAALFTDTLIAGNATLRYDSLDFAGTEMTGDSSLNLMELGVTHLHVDYWSPNATQFRLKLVDFGEDGFGGGNDTEAQIPMTPATGEWVSLDYELADFAGMNMTDVSQLIISADPTRVATVYLDNIYFYVGEPDGEDNVPSAAAPAPVHEGDDIISLFSDAYDDVPVNTWLTSWSNSGYAEDTIAGNAVKLYSNLGFAGVEMLGDSALDLTDMTTLHIDYWTADLDTFLVKLVDFGGDGAGGDNDTEYELAFEVMDSNEWVRLDIALADFEEMNLTDISQFIISARPYGMASVYLDNIYFYNDATVPTSAPKTGNLAAFPNPTSGQVTVTAPARMERLVLFDATGRQVREFRPGSERFDLPLGDLRAGVYVALATTADGRYTVRLRKQ